MSGPSLFSRWWRGTLPEPRLSRDAEPIRAARWQASYRPRPAVFLSLIALGFVLGLAWLVVSQFQSASSQDAFSALRAQSDRTQQLDALLVRVLDAESGVRGYLLTEDPLLLRPLHEGRGEVEEAFRALRADARQRGISEQPIDELEAAVHARWARLTHVVTQRSQPLLRVPDHPTGAELTATIRAQLIGMRAETVKEINAALSHSFDRFAQARGRNLALGLGILVLLALLVVMGLREERLRRSLSDMLHSENERLQRQVEARTAELRYLAAYLTNARETEQERLARELHDELGSLLTAAKLDASWIARKLPADAMVPLQSRFDRLFDTLGQVIALKRKVVANLRPPLLSDLGLMEALRSLAQSGGVGERDGEVRLLFPAELPPLAPDVSLALYRIAQEALTNVRRYAQASEVDVILQVSDDQLVLEVRDNGVGFEPSKRQSNRHGLIGMAHRAQMLTGELQVRSAPGRGTTIRVSVPREKWC